jgi:putative PIN family toxin of toxin-antitoxin system
MIPKDRVVIDTNVYISYLINNKTFNLLSFFINHGITIYSSEEIWTEFFSVTKKKYIKERIPATFYKDKTIYRDATEVIKIEKTFNRAADPDDNFLFDIAFQSKSYYLITEERALLNMKHVGRIQIITLSAFKKLILKG